MCKIGNLSLFFRHCLNWQQVTIPALNDSKLIGICVYNIFFLSIIGVGVNHALKSDPNLSFIFLSLMVIFCTSITLGVVFVPKVY